MNSKEKRIIGTIWVCSIIILMISIWIYIDYAPVTVSFVDVGQGDSCFIRAGRDGNVLIDGGDVGSGKDLLEYFRVENVNKLDAVFVSHFHADHINGIIELIEQGMTIKGLYISKYEEDSELKSKTLKMTAENKIPVYLIGGGEDYMFGKMKYSILWPTEKQENTRLNNQSMIIKGEYQESSVLFTADAEVPAVRALWQNMSDEIKTDILKVPHHGSRYSLENEFFDKCDGEYAVISVGLRNRYDNPSAEIIDCLEENQYRVWRTDYDGMIEFTLGEKGIIGVTVSPKGGKYDSR